MLHWFYLIQFIHFIKGGSWSKGKSGCEANEEDVLASPLSLRRKTNLIKAGMVCVFPASPFNSNINVSNVSRE